MVKDWRWAYIKNVFLLHLLSATASQLEIFNYM